MSRLKLAVPVGFFLLLTPLVAAQDELWSWSGDGRFFGASAAGAGDTDGDGYADVIVGDYGWDTIRGKVVLFSGATGAVLRTWEGEPGWQGLGRQVAGIADVDGDGFDDVAISAFWRGEEAGDFAGRVYAYSGQTGELIWSRAGEAIWDYFGRTMAPAGDANGDGVGDVVVGADYHDGPAGEDSGKVYLLDGTSGALLWSRDGEVAGDRFGAGLAGAGDVDGDGLADVIAGAFAHDAVDGPGAPAGGDTMEGRAYLISGGTGEVLAVFDGEAPFDLFGFNVAGAGDLDGDDHSDVLVSAHRHDGPAGVDAGRVYLFSGATHELLWTLDGESASALLGRGLASAGDVNRDGTGDFLVAAADGTVPERSEVTLYSGTTRRRLWDWQEEAAGGAFGQTLATAGDVDRDGVPDQLIGDWEYRGGDGTGKVYVESGNDLYLKALTETAHEGETMQVQTRGGQPGAQALLFVVDVNGMPYFMLVGRWVLDGHGEWTFGATVPELSEALDVTFESYTLRGGLADSNGEVVRLR